MHTSDRYSISLWLRGGIVLILALAFLIGAPAMPAGAYSGGSTLNFHGGIGSSTPPVLVDGVDIPYYDILGTTSDCLTTKSITAWVRPMGTPPSSYNVLDLETIAGNRQVFFGISRGILNVLFPPSSTDALWVYNVPNTGSGDYRIPIPYTAGEWVHVAFVQSPGFLTAYRNGVFVGQIAAPATADVFFTAFRCGLLTIGQPFEPSVLTFDGQIDEVGFWSTALSAADIRRIMYRELNGSEPGLAAYYKMNEGSGTTVADSSGHGFTGLITGSPNWLTSGAFAGPRNALGFDGATQYITVPDPGTGSALDMTSGGMTFETWVNTPNWNNGVYTPFAVKGDGAASQVNYYFGKSDTNKLVFGFYNGGLITAVDSSPATFNDNTWYHLAYAVDFGAQTVSFYRNGILLSTVSFAATPVLANDQSLALAAFPGSAPAQFFPGQFDEVRLWNTIRSGTQIVDNMFQTLKGDETGLVAYYRFDQYDPAETTLYDVTTHNLDGNMHGMATVPWTTSDAFNTWIGTDSTAWATESNWSRNVLPDPGANTGIYGYSGGNDPVVSSAADTGNLVAASGSSLRVTGTGSLVVEDTLLNNGTLTQVKSVSGGSPVSFFDTGNYGGLIIDPNGDNLGSTTVTIRGNRDCSSTPGDTVRRCFEISPASNNNTINKKLTFFYNSGELSGNTCSLMDAYHRVGSSWVALSLDPAYGSGGRMCAGDPLSVRAMDVTTFSPFVLNQNAPTAITLVSFSGTTGESQMVLVTTLLASVGALGLLLWLRRRLTVR